ncbi:MAG: polyprenyl synthetase family protein [Coriobacteriales bacterium]|nr:polyprenyl synthetase family protein [Coriobacteriales bacterium]
MSEPTPDAAQAFVSFLTSRRHVIDQHVMASVPSARQGDGADALERYLYAPLRRFVASGGKRTRPALCLLGAAAVGAPEERALSVASAVELFQSAALIHDDIADEGQMRRGQPCVHVTEGVGVALNVGDLALVATTTTVLRDQRLDAGTRLRLLEEISAMEERTLEGQALDLGWARDECWDVSVDDYLYMASHKTAYYSAAVPLACGAICGGGTTAQVEALRSFGMDAGLAFQLQDDLLNLAGDAEAQGKDYRSDITEGKRTLMVVWALAHLDSARRDELVQILSSKTTDPQRLDRAVQLMDAAGSLDHTRSYAQRLVDQAKSHLNGVQLEPQARDTLLSMADFFVERRA